MLRTSKCGGFRENTTGLWREVTACGLSHLILRVNKRTRIAFLTQLTKGRRSITAGGSDFTVHKAIVLLAKYQDGYYV